MKTIDLKEVLTEDLRQELKLRGYQTDNLWHVEDVMDKYDCESEDAQEVLIKALDNEATMEQVFLAIDIVADEVFNLKTNEDKPEGELYNHDIEEEQRRLCDDDYLDNSKNNKQ